MDVLQSHVIGKPKAAKVLTEHAEVTCGERLTLFTRHDVETLAGRDGESPFGERLQSTICTSSLNG